MIGERVWDALVVAARYAWYKLQDGGVFVLTRLKEIFAAAWLAVFPPPVPTGPTSTNPPMTEVAEKDLRQGSVKPDGNKNDGVTIFDTAVGPAANNDNRVKFVLVTSTCAWKGASSNDIECGKPEPNHKRKRNFDEVLAELRPALSDAPRILIIGVASCDGVKEALADDRARNLQDRTRRAGLSQKQFIIITLGKFSAPSCESLTKSELAEQRPILVAGVYSDVNGEELKTLVRAALEKYRGRLPQPNSYSKFDFIQ